MSGWRIGYVISNKKIINQILKLNQHLVTCPPTILQHYLIKYFDDIVKITEPQIKSLLDKRKKVEEYLLSKKLEFLPGKSTFYFFISLGYSKLNSAEFSKILLRDFKVSVVGGHGYGKSCDKFIRLSIGTENLKNIYYGIDCIKNLIRKTKIIN